MHTIARPLPALLLASLLASCLSACQTHAPLDASSPSSPAATQGVMKTTAKTARKARAKAAAAIGVPDAPEAPVYVAPQGKAAGALVVLLHGYNSNHHDLVPVAEQAARVGLHALSVPAPLPGYRAGRYQWKKQAPAHTHAYLQKVLRAERAKRAGLPSGPVWLVGFSQGALHSSILTATHPDAYRGVLGISPGGWAVLPEKVARPEVKRPFLLTNGRQEKARYTKKFEEIQALARSGQQPVSITRHDGGHRFPADWQRRFPTIFAQWAMLSKAPPR